MFPNTLTTFTQASWAQTFNQMFKPGTWLYDIIYGALIVFFAYFYTAIVLNPKDLAENLQRYSGFIPGVRPGQKTAEYIDRVLARILLPGALFFAFVAILPWYLIKWANIPFYFGGTALLIVVGVALDTMIQIESHMIMRHYEGFMKKAAAR